MLTTKRLFFSAAFLLSLTLVLGGFVGCGSEDPAGPDGTQMAPIALDEVPQKVTDAALVAVPGGEIIEAEEDAEDGEVEYELKISSGDVIYEVEVEVAADGSIIAVEVEEDDDDDDVENENEAEDDDDDDDDDETEHEEEGEHEGENGVEE